MWNRIERLSDSHNLTTFSCNDESIDNWLHASALSTQAEGGCGVHLAVRDDSAVRGYFTLSYTYLRPLQLPRGGNTRRQETPVILLGKLALHHELQRTGASTLLMGEALRTAVGLWNIGGGSYLVVDVPNVLKHPYYERNGFKRIGTTNRFFMKMSTARAVVAEIG